MCHRINSKTFVCVLLAKKNKKGKALSLAEFHSSVTTEATVAHSSGNARLNWADEMEKLDDGASKQDNIFDTLILAINSCLGLDRGPVSKFFKHKSYIVF